MQLETNELHKTKKNNLT